MQTNNRSNAATSGALALLAMIVCAMAGGCTNSNPYLPPNLPDDQIAKLSTRGGLHLNKLDGKPLDASSVVIGMTKSNQTTATPGRHALEFRKAFGGDSYYRMDLDLAQGSAYEFESIDLGRRIAVTNTTAGRRWEFDYETLTAFDPTGSRHPLSRAISP